VKRLESTVSAVLKVLPLITVLIAGAIWIIDVRAGAAVGPISQRVTVLEQKIDTLRRIESEQSEQRKDIKELLKDER
jgi:hypothetical protein